ncbi:VirB8/TrbF family protein [Fusobacterium sp. SYSU M8A802]
MDKLNNFFQKLKKKNKITKDCTETEKNKTIKEIDYDKATEQLFEFYAQQSKRIMTYKIIALSMLALTITSTLACIYLSTRSTLVPYVVEVDQLGEAKAIRQADQIYIPKEVENRYFIRDIVLKMRSIPRDNVLFSRNFQQLSYFLTEAMLKKHQSILINEDTNTLSKQLISRDINIISFNKVPRTKNTYQVKWNEKMYSAEGVEISDTDFVGLFTITIEQPKDIDEINYNPLGIVVEDFSISKEE